MAKSGKFRGRRREYLKDYELNEEGRYEYQGIRYGWKMLEEERRREVLKLGLLAGMPFICGLIAGCIPAPGVNHWGFLILPYAVGLMACVSLWIALWRMCWEKNPMRGYVYESSVKKIPFRACLAAVLTVFAAAMEIVYIFLYGTAGMALGAFIFIFLELLSALSALYIRRRVCALEWEQIDRK